MEAASGADSYRCPRCGASTTKDLLAEGGYTCRRCTFEVAHLDLAPNGSVRNVIGWLRTPGAVLADRYRVVGVLGKGGFAATYLVEDLRLKGKRRALKEIPEIQYDEYETNLLSRLRHPAIPDISDKFAADGMLYLVLEFGGDRTLETERRAHGGKVPLDKLMPWMRQLCDVLAYLHGQDPPVVHRDLKPENILLDEQDHVMLIDFGIAKESSEFAVTRTIARSASHGFSPPEQVLGTGTDQRSDVYSLGATMYALLTGHVPAPAHERVAGRELSTPRALKVEIPAALEAAIVRALDLNVNNRQQSITELSQELEPCLVGEGDETGPFAARTARIAPPSGPVAAAGRVAERGLGGAKARAPGEKEGVTVAEGAAPAGALGNRRRRLLWAAVPVAVVAVLVAWYLLRPRSKIEVAEPHTPPPVAKQGPGPSPNMEGEADVVSGGSALSELEERIKRGGEQATPTARAGRRGPRSTGRVTRPGVKPQWGGIEYRGAERVGQ